MCTFYGQNKRNVNSVFLEVAIPEFWQYKYIAFAYSRQMHEYFGVHKILIERKKQRALLTSVEYTISKWIRRK